MNIQQSRSRLKDLTKLIETAKIDVSTAQKKLSQLEKEQIELTKFLNTPNETIGVSDHALIRYLERKYGFNFDEYRNEILTPDRISMIKSGAQTISVNGVKMKIDKNTVVTVI